MNCKEDLSNISIEIMDIDLLRDIELEFKSKSMFILMYLIGIFVVLGFLLCSIYIATTGYILIPLCTLFIFSTLMTYLFFSYKINRDLCDVIRKVNNIVNEKCNNENISFLALNDSIYTSSMYGSILVKILLLERFRKVVQALG